MCLYVLTWQKFSILCNKFLKIPMYTSLIWDKFKSLRGYWYNTEFLLHWGLTGDDAEKRSHAICSKNHPLVWLGRCSAFQLFLTVSWRKTNTLDNKESERLTACRTQPFGTEISYFLRGMPVTFWEAHFESAEHPYYGSKINSRVGEKVFGNNISEFKLPSLLVHSPAPCHICSRQKLVPKAYINIIHNQLESSIDKNTKRRNIMQQT